MTNDQPPQGRGECAELLDSLARRRTVLLRTVRDLDDEQAARRTTASELCLGGLVKHVATVEERWCRFIVGGAEAMDSEPLDWEGQFRMAPGETLAALVEQYRRVGEATEAAVRALPDLDLTHRLPERPWHKPGSAWSVRQVLLHLIGETAQHAGHADIIRESLDGAKST